MGEGFIVRRGGTGGLSGCTVVVFAGSGSTVAAYSDAAATVKVKDGKELGTGGSYYITGLAVGTYYIKATRGTQTKISPAVSFAAEGIQTVALSYEKVLFRDGVLAAELGNLHKNGGSGAAALWRLEGGNLQAANDTSQGGYANLYGGFDNPIDITGFTALHVRAASIYGDLDVSAHSIGLAATNTTSYADIEASVSPSGSAEYTVDLTGLSGTSYYLIVFHNLKAGYNKYGWMTTTISEMWLE